MIMPSGSLAVFALNCFTKSIMLTPCGPSAVPTGGAGVALPAGNCNFTIAWTFFAIAVPRNPRRGTSFAPAQKLTRKLLGHFLDLHEIELDRSRAAKNRDRNLQRVAVGVHVVHHARKIRERP